MSEKAAKKKESSKKAHVTWSQVLGGYYVVKDYKPAPASDEDIDRYAKNLLRKGALSG